jgi:hypothetical protein
MDKLFGAEKLAQIALIVKDIEKTKARIAALLGVPAPASVTGGDYAVTQVEYKGAPAPAASGGLKAKPNQASILVADDEAAMTAYLINDYNYLKLRDIAFLLKDTGKKFSLAYDDATGVIEISAGADYAPAGDELSALGEPKKTVARSQEISIGGETAKLDAYNIDGYTYFKLRDIADLLGIKIVPQGSLYKLVLE